MFTCVYIYIYIDSMSHLYVYIYIYIHVISTYILGQIRKTITQSQVFYLILDHVISFIYRINDYDYVYGFQCFNHAS